MAVPYVTMVDARVVGDPKFKYSENGMPIVQMRLVASDRKLNRDTNQWEDGDTFWVTAKAFKALAENITESVKDRDVVTVVGRLVTNTWTDEGGAKRTAPGLVLVSCGVSLAFRARPHASDVAAAQGPKTRAVVEPHHAPVEESGEEWSTPVAAGEDPWA